MTDGLGKLGRMVVGMYSYRGSSPSTPLLSRRIKDENRRDSSLGACDDSYRWKRTNSAGGKNEEKGCRGGARSVVDV